MNPFQSPLADGTSRPSKKQGQPGRYGRAGSVAVVLLSSLMGAGVWALSPWLTGHSEPWDGQGYYLPALVVAGALGAIPYPSKCRLVPPGVVPGQMLYVLAFLPVGLLFLIGALLIVFASLAALLGGGLTYGLSIAITQKRFS